MKKTTKRAISMCVVVALIAGLAGLYFLRPAETEADEEAPVTAATFLIEREESDVARVRFISQDDDFVMTPYETDQGILWQYQPNPDFLLNPVRARDKVRSGWHLTMMDIVHEDAGSVDVADFGFDPPLLTMEVTYTDGTSQTIYFGAQTADMRHRFARLSGSDAIYTIGNMTAQWAMADVANLIERGLMPFTAEAEYMLIAQRDTPTIELTLDSEWEAADAMAALVPGTPQMPMLHLIQPIDRAVDPSRLTARVLEPLEHFRLGDVVSLTPANLADYGLDVPSLEFVYRDMFGEVHLLLGDTFIEDVGGAEVEFIYVKFADRPHVFRAEFLPISGLFNLNIFTFIDRFIALPNIVTVDGITITSPVEARNFGMVINHVGESDIAPTINGVPIDAADFRVAYRLLIALMMEGEIEPFTPEGVADVTIVYHRPEEPDIEIRLFAMGSHLYAVSVDGADAWFVTHGRDVDVFFGHVTALMAG